MRFGFHTIHFSPMFGATAPLLDVIGLTGTAGFDAIGIDLASVEAHVQGGGSVQEMAAAIENAGLRCSDVLVLVPGADHDVVASAHALGRLASAVEAPACIAAVAVPMPWDELVTSLQQCASILAHSGCRLAIEFTPYSALATLQEAKALCDAVGWHRCGLVLDSLHFFRSGAPWGALVDVDADQIAVVQWDDAPAEPSTSLVDESRNQRLLPGEGGLDLPALAAAIRDTGWDGVVSAEILSERVRRTDPAVAVRDAYAAMTAAAAGWVAATSSAG
jgi:sugar phosphate isomerase/epimerase